MWLLVCGTLRGVDIPLWPVLLIGFFFIAVGVWFALFGRGVARADAAFRRRAHVVEAEVLELRTYYGEDAEIEDASGTWRHHPVVRFPLPDGRVVEAETMTGSSLAPAHAGERLQVRYDPSDPTHVDIVGGPAQRSMISGIHMALGVVLALTGCGALGFWALIVLVLDVPV